MKKWIVIVVALLGIVLPTTTHAEDLNFSVNANLPANQIDSKNTYFDLKVEPSQTQNLEITIHNNYKTAHTFKVSPNQAVTNVNGIVDYSNHNLKKDSTLAAPFESMMAEPKTVTVAGNTDQTVSLKLTVPEKAFRGTVLGGIQVRDLTAGGQAKKTKGISLTNKYAYVIGVQLREETDELVEPNLKLNQIKTKQMNGYNSIAANLQNTEPVILHDFVVKAHINKRGSSKSVITTNKKDMTMAPNSNFDFELTPKDNKLTPGKYTLYLDAKGEDGKYHWKFKRDFVITQAEASRLNRSIVNGQNYFWWLVIAVAFIILLILALIYMIWRLRKNKKAQD